jgi:hypothetical protein
MSHFRMFPFLVSCNEFVRIPIEAPLEGSVTRLVIGQLLVPFALLCNTESMLGTHWRVRCLDTRAGMNTKYRTYIGI